MVVYDVTDMDSFFDIRRIWMDFIKMVSWLVSVQSFGAIKLFWQKAQDNVVIIFVGNKSDLVEQKVVSEDMGREVHV